MIKRFFGAHVDARIVAAARMIAAAAIVAALAAAEKVLADPGLESYGWVPIALLAIRTIEGFFDHSDSTRPG